MRQMRKEKKQEIHVLQYKKPVIFSFSFVLLVKNRQCRKAVEQNIQTTKTTKQKIQIKIDDK